MARYIIDRDKLLQFVKESNVERASDNRRKRHLQTEICQKYNESESSQIPACVLQKSWNNQKTRAREKKSNYVKAQRATGGGPPPGKFCNLFLPTPGIPQNKICPLCMTPFQISCVKLPKWRPKQFGNLSQNPYIQLVDNSFWQRAVKISNSQSHYHE